MVSLKNSHQAMLSVEELEALQGQQDSGIVKVREEIHVALYPKYLLNIRIGIANYLNGKINQWHPKLNGILAAYSSLKLFHSTGTLANEEAHIHLDVIGDFWLFRPEVGSQLKGVVTKKSPSHISCLVHGVFNVPCYKPDDIEPTDDWLGTNIPVGSTVLFTVLKTDMSQRIPFILGKLNNDQYTEEKNHLTKTIQIVRGSDDWNKELKNTTTANIAESDAETGNETEQIETSYSARKKASKRKATEQIEDDSTEQEGSKRSKKSNKSKKPEKNRSLGEVVVKEEDDNREYLIKILIDDDHFENSPRKSSKKSKKKSKDPDMDEAEIEAQRDLLLQSLTSKVHSSKKKKKAKDKKRELEEEVKAKEVEIPKNQSSKKKGKTLLLNDRSTLSDPVPSFMVPTSTPKEKFAPATAGEDPRQNLIGNMLSKFSHKMSRKSK